MAIQSWFRHITQISKISQEKQRKLIIKKIKTARNFAGVWVHDESNKLCSAAGGGHVDSACVHMIIQQLKLMIKDYENMNKMSAIAADLALPVEEAKEPTSE